jgi:hypothetical protein
MSLFIPCMNKANAQDTKSSQADRIKQLVDSQNYVFRAQTALPMRGGSKQLTTEYTLKVSKDTIDADLPYFGRAYNAPMDASQGGIRFQSTEFQYSKVSSKKGRWNVVIKPLDLKDPRQLTISISSSGSASLQVLSNNRDAISFNGEIVEKKSR